MRGHLEGPTVRGKSVRRIGGTIYNIGFLCFLLGHRGVVPWRGSGLVGLCGSGTPSFYCGWRGIGGGREGFYSNQPLLRIHIFNI